MKTKSELSRRTAVVGALALAPAAATAAMPIGADPEAELMEVGRELLALYEQRTVVDKIAAPMVYEFYERVHALRRTFDEARRNGGERAVNELFKIKDAEMREALGPQFDTVTKEQEMLSEAIDPLARRMLALPVHTVRGVALKAVFAAYDNPNLWHCPSKDLDQPEEFVRHLIEAVLALAGYELPTLPAAGAPHPDQLEEPDPMFALIEQHREVLKPVARRGRVARRFMRNMTSRRF
jgi:hypothetical protein